MVVYFNSDMSETHASTRRAGEAMAKGFAVAMDLMAAFERDGPSVSAELPALVSRMASSFALAAVVHSEVAARSALGSTPFDAAAAAQFARLRDLSRMLGTGIVDAALARLPEPDRSTMAEAPPAVPIAWTTLLRVASEGARLAAERAIALEEGGTPPAKLRDFAADLAALQMLGVVIARLLSRSG